MGRKEQATVCQIRTENGLSCRGCTYNQYCERVNGSDSMPDVNNRMNGGKNNGNQQKNN